MFSSILSNRKQVSVTGICITPDCKKVVVSYDDTNIRIWNLSDGGLIYSFPNSNPVIINQIPFFISLRLLVAV